MREPQELPRLTRPKPAGLRWYLGAPLVRYALVAACAASTVTGVVFWAQAHREPVPAPVTPSAVTTTLPAPTITITKRVTTPSTPHHRSSPAAR